MMGLINLTNPPQALGRRLVADMAAERIAGVGRVDDHATGAHDICCLPDQARLRMGRVNGKKLCHKN